MNKAFSFLCAALLAIGIISVNSAHADSMKWSSKDEISGAQTSTVCANNDKTARGTLCIRVEEDKSVTAFANFNGSIIWDFNQYAPAGQSQKMEIRADFNDGTSAHGSYTVAPAQGRQHVAFILSENSVMDLVTTFKRAKKITVRIPTYGEGSETMVFTSKSGNFYKDAK